MAMKAFKTSPQSILHKLGPRGMPIGLALLVGALTAFAPITALPAQDSPKRQAASSPQPAKVKPQQRRQNKPAKAKAAPSAKKTAVTGAPLESSAQTRAWAQDVTQRLQLDPIWLQNTLSQAKRLPSVERFILPPSSPTAKNWAAYRARFIEPTRIQAGARFWQTHRSALERAEREYGVPASLIVGIIGVETLYGQNTGNFRILDALATLTFHFPSAHPRAAARQAFFQSELEQFLLLTSRSGADPLAIRGSYAGAMGLPQFMPSSWAKFAVDFDGDGRIDLFDSPTDAIGSVANYFKAFDWRPGMPTHYPVSLTPGQTRMDSLLAPDILPTFSVANFVSQGAALAGAALQHTGPLALIELLNGPDAPSYVAGTENFYAITRYNWSSYYAMAVIELAEAVTREMQIKR
jgi:membrane-bound lytic murein transglycosylase B